MLTFRNAIVELRIGRLLIRFFPDWDLWKWIGFHIGKFSITLWFVEVKYEDKNV